MMMSLGVFVFEIGTLPYQELRRRTDWRHASSSRVGARPAGQFVGPGEDRISLSGWIAPEVAGDPTSLDTLRDMADEGESYPLVDGAGNVLGAFVIDSVDESQSVFLQDGTPRKIEFGLDLHHVDDDASDSASAQAAAPAG